MVRVAQRTSENGVRRVTGMCRDYGRRGRIQGWSTFAALRVRDTKSRSRSGGEFQLGESTSTAFADASVALAVTGDDHMGRHN